MQHGPNPKNMSKRVLLAVALFVVWVAAATYVVMKSPDFSFAICSITFVLVLAVVDAILGDPIVRLFLKAIETPDRRQHSHDS